MPRRALLAAVAVAAMTVPATAAARIPKASDYHSLLVVRTHPLTFLLGTHTGLYRSDDGGRTWRAAGLEGVDAMNLVRAGSTILLGGHNVFALSRNAGVTWTTTTPKGLPSLDVHGLDVDPRDPNVVYAQIAMTGLYRSTDAGRSFRLVSSDVNGMMMAVAKTPAGKLIVGDMSRGVFTSLDGHHWLHTANGMVMGLAADPSNPRRIVATGRGIAISNDAGRSWTIALSSKSMFGPVAWSPTGSTVFAVGFDRTLWRSSDAGSTWRRVG